MLEEIPQDYKILLHTIYNHPSFKTNIILDCFPLLFLFEEKQRKIYANYMAEIRINDYFVYPDLVQKKKVAPSDDFKKWHSNLESATKKSQNLQQDKHKIILSYSNYLIKIFDAKKFETLFLSAATEKMLYSYGVNIKEVHDREGTPISQLIADQKVKHKNSAVFIPSHTYYLEHYTKRAATIFANCFEGSLASLLATIQSQSTYQNLEEKAHHLDQIFIEKNSAPTNTSKKHVNFIAMGVGISFFWALYTVINNVSKNENENNYFAIAAFCVILALYFLYDKILSPSACTDPSKLQSYDFEQIKFDYGQIGNSIQWAIKVNVKKFITPENGEEKTSFPETTIDTDIIEPYYHQEGIRIPRNPAANEGNVKQQETNFNQIAQAPKTPSKLKMFKAVEPRYDGEEIKIRSSKHLVLLIPAHSPFLYKNFVKEAAEIHGIKDAGKGIKSLTGPALKIKVPLSIDGKQQEKPLKFTFEIHDPNETDRIYCVQFGKYLIPVYEASALHTGAAIKKLQQTDLSLSLTTRHPDIEEENIKVAKRPK